MKKTIKSFQQTSHFHPAVGPLYLLEFTDGTSASTYAETFFHQIPNFEPGVTELVGQELDTENAFFS